MGQLLKGHEVMSKIIYIIDPDTGLFVGEAPHPIDPVRSAREGETVYATLNAGHATELAPPQTPEGMRNRLVDGEWIQEEVPPPSGEDAAAPPDGDAVGDDHVSVDQARISALEGGLARALERLDDLEEKARVLTSN
jgi:hypothetical protein